LAPAPKAFVQKCAEKTQENNILATELVFIATCGPRLMLRCDSGRL
jgi:hypothetical protein